MNKQKIGQDVSNWIETVIKDFIRTSPENALQGQFDEKAWETALVGFSNGADPIFQDYKEHVGAFHWTPAEIFSEMYPDVEFEPQELTIISWVLPQTDATKMDNRKEKNRPAERWARSRIFGEKANEALRHHLADTLKAKGYQAFAPTLTPNWKFKKSDRFVFASTWSERHAAFAAGLGTFGVCDGLITSKGKAMRVGSVIARLTVEPTPRPYTDHNAYCLFYSKGLCGECIPRCPVNALSEKGHDKETCQKFLVVTAEYVEKNFGFKGYGCGLCQTGVPCESKIPTQKDLKQV